MIAIGKVSYGMYIYHWLVWGYLFNAVFKPDTVLMRAALFIPYLITVYLVSAVSYRLFEVHFINLKDRFFPPQGGLKKVS
jgi:peptidoglycan/LPS O-acetylase OafA/YrhL